MSSRAVTPAENGLAEKRRQFLRRLSGFTPSETGGAEIRRLDYPGADLYLYVTSRAEKKARTVSCAKEPWTVEWIERAVGAGQVVYDIGANVGAYSLIAAHRVGAAGRVFAFEPGYATFAHLCDNVVLNDFGSVIVPVPLPLAGATALGSFAYQKLYPGHARHLGLGAGSMTDQGRIVYEQPALTMRLDDLVSTFGLPRPDHLKLDVDGAEVGVLAGSGDVLADTTLKSVLVEVDDINSRPVMEALERAGLRLAARHERGAGLPFWYGIFERPR